MKEPVRLHKVEQNNYSFDFGRWMLLHPSTILIGIGIAVFLVGALVFAVTGHAAVDSGGMRNFLAAGV